MAPSSPGVRSPCIGVCRMEAVTGWCEGCLRTLDEIAAWSTLGDHEKRAVWATLHERRRQRAARVAAPDGHRPPEEPR